MTADAEDELPSVCSRCGASLVPLPVIYSERICVECGSTTYVHERDPKKGGMRVRRGDRIVVPRGALQISFDLNQPGVRFSRHGMAWFAKLLYFDGMDSLDTSIDGVLDRYQLQANHVLETSELLKGLDLEKPEDAERILDIIKDHDELPEFWAMQVSALRLFVNQAIERGDGMTAAKAAVAMANARGMLIFLQSFQPRIWASYTIDQIGSVLSEWNANKLNNNEEFWQNLVAANTMILSQLFSAPFIYFKSKAYVGGKAIANKGGSESDYILRNPITENVAVVEIKVPTTKLLGRKYRGVYSVSSDLSGAIIQTLNYKDDLLKHYFAVAGSSDDVYNAFNPPCILIVGSKENELDNPVKATSFELFRREMRDIQVVTYDEVFIKMEQLLRLLQDSEQT